MRKGGLDNQIRILIKFDQRINKFRGEKNNFKKHNKGTVNIFYTFINALIFIIYIMM